MPAPPGPVSKRRGRSDDGPCIRRDRRPDGACATRRRPGRVSGIGSGGAPIRSTPTGLARERPGPRQGPSAEPIGRVGWPPSAGCATTRQAHALNIDFADQDVPTSIPDDAALSLYRTAQAALRNIIKNRGARPGYHETDDAPTSGRLPCDDRVSCWRTTTDWSVRRSRDCSRPTLTWSGRSRTAAPARGRPRTPVRHRRARHRHALTERAGRRPTAQASDARGQVDLPDGERAPGPRRRGLPASTGSQIGKPSMYM